MPKISCLMAVYNQAATVSGAIKSILNQTYPDFELIIVNDGSMAATGSILESLTLQDKRIILINNRRHLGLTKSLNKAIKVARGLYFARMDADDLAFPQRFAEQIAYLKSHPKIYLLGTAVELINDQGKVIGLRRFASDYVTLRRQILSFCPFIHPTWMFKRNYYSEKFPLAQDYDLALRFLAHHQAANLAKPLLQYRVNSPQAISFKHLKQQEYYALKARFYALAQYGYSWLEAWKLIKPLLSFLIPVRIKLIIYRYFFWR
ncbi:MAG: glycosyltransferase [Patescibacteria group bacterium]